MARGGVVSAVLVPVRDSLAQGCLTDGSGGAVLAVFRSIATCWCAAACAAVSALGADWPFVCFRGEGRVPYKQGPTTHQEVGRLRKPTSGLKPTGSDVNCV